MNEFPGMFWPKQGLVFKYFKRNFLCLHVDPKYVFGVNVFTRDSVVKTVELAMCIGLQIYTFEIDYINIWIQWTPKYTFTSKKQHRLYVSYDHNTFLCNITCIWGRNKLSTSTRLISASSWLRQSERRLRECVKRKRNITDSSTAPPPPPSNRYQNHFP